MSGNEKKEFGDYQTPRAFCKKVCNYIKDNHMVEGLDAALEPTCGIGNFLQAVEEAFGFKRIYGVEIKASYTEQARRKTSVAKILEGNIFDVNTKRICGADNVLIIGNPPWANNADLISNLPTKENFKGLRGIDAITGSANFDICEYIILKLLGEHKDTDSVICMLCKTTVARNVLREIERNEISFHKIQMLRFDASKVFGISVAACILIIRLSEKKTKNKITCEFKDFETGEYLDTIIVEGGVVRSSKDDRILEGKCQLTWRQGVKHDCGKVMELKQEDDSFFNKYGEQVSIEGDCMFPLVKSSDFKKPIISEFDKRVIVTQKKVKQDTSYIQRQYPQTWAYLQEHMEDFSKRKSVIYRNTPLFSMFGIGTYTFAPYKVGVSGFYKKPKFSLLYADKPVMTDDTTYFLPFDDYDTAYSAMLLLNNDKIQTFLQSIAFLDSKRPYTVKLLARVDLIKCIENVTFEEMKQTEKNLGLNSYITEVRYKEFEYYIRSVHSAG